MLIYSNFSKTQRLILGIFILLLVDVIWVVSSEVTEFIFKDAKFSKPYFSTYLKTSMFILYLAGFLAFRSWRQQCRKNSLTQSTGFEALDTFLQLVDPTSSDQKEEDQLISDPIFVPVKYDDKGNASGTDSDDGSGKDCATAKTKEKNRSRSVRFNQLSEVRQLSENQAEDAIMARLSYSAFVRAEEYRLRFLSKMTVKQIAKIAFIFCVLFFFGNLAYQEALKDTEAGVVNVLSSTSGLFTLVLAAMFPSSSMDKFTLSKFVCVLFSIGGVVLVSLSDLNIESEIPLGALWALCGALLYAIYLVTLKRKVDNEDKLNLPMFFGFVGFFCMIILWPGFFILHYSKAEVFEWPTKMDWVYLVANGVIGTVLSEILWLWGCFLTSSLMGTLSLSLTIPLTMIADTVMKNVSYTWMFYVGSGPVFISFFAVTVLSHYENWDPVLLGVKKLIHCVCRKRASVLPRLRDLDREQTESLISVNTAPHD
ncbi:solute carrier family 35 member F5-like isoform X2 [Lineus longissimus]|uniref:solute carrier family 35 member F5-like isoform X2 n=1 Tax=Lineus longissimus TaxID=88925 RepID=UPI00315C975E